MYGCFVISRHSFLLRALWNVWDSDTMIPLSGIGTEYQVLLWDQIYFHTASHALSYLCRKQASLWAHGDIHRSKQRQYEERSVPHLISSMDNLSINTSIFKSYSLDRMEEVRCCSFLQRHFGLGITIIAKNLLIVWCTCLKLVLLTKKIVLQT